MDEEKKARSDRSLNLMAMAAIVVAAVSNIILFLLNIIAKN